MACTGVDRLVRPRLFVQVAVDAPVTVAPRYATAELLAGTTVTFPPAGVNLGALLEADQAINSISVGSEFSFLASTTTLRRRVANAANAARTNAVPLTTSTPAVVCDISESGAFVAQRGRGLGPEMACAFTNQDGGQVACVTLADYHVACLRSLDCAGYTTRDGGIMEDEVPVALHARTAAVAANVADAARGYVFFEKLPAARRSCEFPVDTAGDVTVLVSQASMASGYVQVHVRRGGSTTTPTLRVGECGGAHTFLAGGFGTNAACNNFLACATVEALPAGSTVSVAVSPTAVPFSCTGAATVLALLNVTTATSVGPSPTTQTIDVDDVIFVPPPRSAAEPTLLFAYETQSVALLAAQTVYATMAVVASVAAHHTLRVLSWPSTWSTTVPSGLSSSSVVAPTTLSVELDSCGSGSEGFLNGTMGMSAQCEYLAVCSRRQGAGASDALVNVANATSAQGSLATSSTSARFQGFLAVSASSAVLAATNPLTSNTSCSAGPLLSVSLRSASGTTAIAGVAFLPDENGAVDAVAVTTHLVRGAAVATRTVFDGNTSATLNANVTTTSLLEMELPATRRRHHAVWRAARGSFPGYRGTRSRAGGARCPRHGAAILRPARALVGRFS
jgi:hypothetical protein